MQLVWFKRDLRVQDHGALSFASQRGPVLPLYVVEPDYWAQGDASRRQWVFASETLAELRKHLAGLGQPLVVRVGDVVEVLDSLQREHRVEVLWSHEETGNGWTYARDKRVAAWCRERGLPWHEISQHGVQRRLASRAGWAGHWDRFMAEPMAQPPVLAPVHIAAGQIPTASDLNLAADGATDTQPAGRHLAQELLSSFLAERGQIYRRALSSPVTGAHACSRLSPHLAWGSLSMREVTQATWAKQRDVKARGLRDGWSGAMSSFSSRLHWHCHFIQKLEDAPRIEFENLHRGYDGIRSSAPDRERLEAWARGETGLPFVDACMRALRATGWLNFRMRAMVMSVASYHLWLHWRAPGLALARLFTDYEPGIHWSQVQMQSGTTGINTVRIYNPVKQGQDQDPTGAFTRRWVPELAQIEDRFLHAPWQADNASAVLGRAYPMPIVDHLSAARDARERVWAVRKGAAFRQEAQELVVKHASRKPTRLRENKKAPTAQLDLPF
ncbi:deoxyribodipyrimidine photo-lyase [Shimia sp. NS0008-38b]|uniref:cryptochrome/deoxyribodipyrimidine photo-lyase family protein n=1 Tax=Shimia sp. NS0008-38b TaxID=3127653 RepID=UPI0031024DDC